MDQLFLPSRIRQELSAHALQVLPAEAVGFLAGKDRKVELVIPLANIASAGAFLADPFSQYLAEREIESRGLQVLGIYHSHPGGCTCLSKQDIEFGKAWSCAHLVLSIDPSVGHIQELQAYNIIRGEAHDVELSLCD